MPRKSEPGLHNRIRELRSEAGMTQQALANQIGVTRQTVVALERGGYVPSLTLAMHLARLFGTTVERVFWFDDSVGDSSPQPTVDPPPRQ